MSHIAISMPALGVQEGLEKPKIALRVPWTSSPMMLGTGYDSTAMHFTYSSPFKSLRDVAYYDQHEPRRQASYIQATSNRSSSVHEHVDLAFQGEIGNALAGGSARGNYMKRVAQDRSGTRLSTRVSSREGSIRFGTTPVLRTEAVELLVRQPNEFRRRFGDYFVSSMILGADNAVFLSLSAEDNNTLEAFHATIEGHLLGLGANKTVATLDQAASQKCEVQVEVFDSLWNKHESRYFSTSSGDTTEFQTLKDLALTYLEAGKRLSHRAKEATKPIVEGSREISAASVEALAASANVAELSLLPFASLREFMMASALHRLV